MSKPIVSVVVVVHGTEIKVSTIAVRDPLDGRRVMYWETAIGIGRRFSDGIRSAKRAEAAIVHDDVCDIVRGYKTDEHSRRVHEVRAMAADCMA